MEKTGAMSSIRKKSIIPFISRLMAAGIVILFLYLVRVAPEYVRPAGSGDISAAVSLGALIILAWVMGDLFQRISLPRITGYMVTGIILGPHATNLIRKESLQTLRFVDNMALALIALHAGSEVNTRLLRKRIKGILSVTFFILLFSLTGVFLLIIIGGRFFLPFLEGAPFKIVFLVAMLFGMIEVAKSPVTTIAILDETRAKGPMSEMTLGIVVLKDIVLIALFGIVMGVCDRIAYPDKAHGGIMAETLWSLLGSIGIGALFGMVAGMLLRYAGGRIYILVIALALGLTLLCSYIHLEVLLVSMTVGFIIENFTRQGDRFMKGITDVSPLIYLVFFPVASASLDITILKSIWVVAMVIVMLRKIFVYMGIRVGLWLSEDVPALRKYGWMGFINQSGVTLALALIIGREFPDFGEHFKAIALGMIVLTDFYGPALFKYGLHLAGETRTDIKKRGMAEGES